MAMLKQVLRLIKPCPHKSWRFVAILTLDEGRWMLYVYPVSAGLLWLRRDFGELNFTVVDPSSFPKDMQHTINNTTRWMLYQLPGEQRLALERRGMQP
jgi:hypothetical protein